MFRRDPTILPPVPYLHYHADQFGNVKFLLDGNNVGVEKYTYDAYGAPTITDWSGVPRMATAYNNRFMYNGREYLSEAGIYDYRARSYLASLGRFLQPDPIGFAATPLIFIVTAPIIRRTGVTPTEPMRFRRMAIGFMLFLADKAT